MPRRQFLRACAVGAAVAVGMKARADERRAPSTRGIGEGIMLDRVGVATFEARVGETFLARAEDGSPSELHLIEAKPLPPRPGMAGQGIREDPFSLLFRADPDAGLAQATYAIEHPKLGRFALFLCPIGMRKPSEPIVLQAIFG